MTSLISVNVEFEVTERVKTVPQVNIKRQPFKTLKNMIALHPKSSHHGQNRLVRIHIHIRIRKLQNKGLYRT